ncbi:MULTISPECIES: glycosyltransferase [unclassified Anabaena]|uniref:glycosyltransferase n=1 Tax=unclassified Anabaena TaxID=2619674 RepID=UPI00082D75BA|nr:MULTISPECIES: glycosyltransferase [unclassified Anabaena]
MPKKVSVIIPCFNAEKWLKEAINSCLEQTYSNLEIIVIDDGSTDNSLEIIKSYGDKIIWRSLPHQGGNYARNRGFELSQGEYIQYLDADDYIWPEKIKRQVSFLETTDADVIYGDWRHQRHLPNGSSFLDKREISGTQADILAALLANWWVALAALMYKRSAVEKSGGWDEKLTAAQDRDFFLSVVMAGAKVVYQPGCYSVYRRYGAVTVSTGSKNRWLKNHHLVLKKVEQQLLQKNRLSQSYRQALAKSYFELAREALFFDYSQYLMFLDEALVMFPDFKANSKRIFYRLVQDILGFRQTERIACSILFAKKFVTASLAYPKAKLGMTS